MASLEAFVPALIVVDMQEDFCPPVSLKMSGLQLLKLGHADGSLSRRL